jgi:hypothetical protein
MNTKPQQKHIDSFLKHQKLWGALLMVGWFTINTIVLATTTLLEFKRSDKSIAIWEPFCWELSSIVTILLLIPLGIFLSDRWLGKFSWKPRLLMHLLMTIPFSIIHIVGMVVIRKIWYSAMNMPYHFGDLPLEFLYEYRKDAQSYLTIALVVFGYRLIVRRLQGEASYLAENDPAENTNDEPESTPERLLIKKLGREFLIQTSAIEWIEASGNYANLHINNHVYPMRITMEKLEKSLPENFARVHRSSIVNLNQVQHLEALDSGDYEISLRAGVKLILSRRYRDNFKGRHSFE